MQEVMAYTLDGNTLMNAEMIIRPMILRETCDIELHL